MEHGNCESSSVVRKMATAPPAICAPTSRGFFVPSFRVPRTPDYELVMTKLF